MNPAIPIVVLMHSWLPSGQSLPVPMASPGYAETTAALPSALGRSAEGAERFLASLVQDATSGAPRAQLLKRIQEDKQIGNPGAVLEWVLAAAAGMKSLTVDDNTCTVLIAGELERISKIHSIAETIREEKKSKSDPKNSANTVADCRRQLARLSKPWSYQPTIRLEVGSLGRIRITEGAPVAVVGAGVIDPSRMLSAKAIAQIRAGSVVGSPNEPDNINSAWKVHVIQVFTDRRLLVEYPAPGGAIVVCGWDDAGVVDDSWIVLDGLFKCRASTTYDTVYGSKTLWEIERWIQS